MARMTLFARVVLSCLLAASAVQAQDSGSRCHKAGMDRQINTFPSVPVCLAASSPFFQPVQKFDLEVSSVDPELQELGLLDPVERRKYVVKIDKSVKLRADKKVMRGRPQVNDFSPGDTVRATVNLLEGKVLKIKLLESINGQMAKARAD